jgi:hypothetical protein
MAYELFEFARSSNGDRWLIGRHQITGFAYVIHEANEPSGGTVTEIELAAFLTANASHPEAERLLRLIGAWATSALPEPPVRDIGSQST